MFRFIRIFTLIIFCSYCVVSNGQTLHRLSEELPQINKKFQLNVYVILDAQGNPNVTLLEMEENVAHANQMFSPIGISFSICEWNTISDYNFDDVREGLEFLEMRTHHRKNNLINVYLHEQVSNNSITCGFASFGQIAGENNAYVALRKNCEESLAHELGHLFGLLHTFEGNGNENVDGSNCATSGDLICDTPADPFDINEIVTTWVTGNSCEFIFEGLDANGEFYQPDVGNMMSLYECRCGFTHEQYLKMANNYLNGLKRIW